MAINWKLRETVLRLLTAVYAEIGEEGFKGRYGRIAQLFGPDATYDAIKSFFAKEIARGAERLKSQHPGLRATGRRVSHRASRCSLYGIPTYLDEDEEMQDELEGEEVEEIRMPRPQQVRRYFADPPRRPTTIDLTTENEGFETQSQETSLASEPPQLVTNGVGTAGGKARQQHQQPANTRQKITSPAGFQRSGPTRTRNAPAKQTPPSRPTMRKRPHTIAFDVDDAFIETDEADHSQHQSQSSSPSFGYTTRDNKHRCALCSSSFSSQQALTRHEDSNRAHMINLTNAFMVERAHSRLANINELEAATSKPSRSNAIPRPTHTRPVNGTNKNDEVSTPPTQTFQAQSHQRSHHPQLRPHAVSVLSTFDEGESESISLGHPPEVRSMLFSNLSGRASAPAAPPSTSAPSESPITPASDQQASSADKGKGRAITPELTPSTAIGRGEDGPGSSAWSSSDNAGAELQLHRSLASAQQGLFEREMSTSEEADDERHDGPQQQPLPLLQANGANSHASARDTAPRSQPMPFGNARAESAERQQYRPQHPQPQPQARPQTTTQTPIFPPPPLTHEAAPPADPSSNTPTAPPTGPPQPTTNPATTTSPPTTNTNADTLAPDAAAYATAITQLRASIGVLGERYIATHPEWLATMMGALQREVLAHNSGVAADDSGVGSSTSGGGTSASASASAYSDGSRSMPPPPLPPASTRSESLGTTITRSSAGESEVMPGLWVGSRVGFGGGGGGVVRVQGGRGGKGGQERGQMGKSAEIHRVGLERERGGRDGGGRAGEGLGRAGKQKRSDAVVILVD